MNLAKKLFAIIFIVGLLSSCDEEPSSGKQDQRIGLKLQKMSSFTDAEIGILENKQLKILVSKNQILSYAKEALRDTKLNLTPIDYKIIEDNNKNYIRVFSKNNYVSTAELIINENGVLKVGKTVCTSTACASGGGCIPNGSYCTACTPPNSPGLPGSGDCTRTTTGD
ncbi:MAG: hypothetical protein EOO46_16910 [Flavobacterium sp.]|nr:MAG: hypothetical protein EOO46_16910 [Flavobacterium sp.]